MSISHLYPMSMFMSDSCFRNLEHFLVLRGCIRSDSGLDSTVNRLPLIALEATVSYRVWSIAGPPR